MKKSVQKKQNAFSEKPGKEGLASCGQNDEGVQTGPVKPKVRLSLQQVLQSYRKLEHPVFGKVDTLCVGGHKVFYAATDVERVLGFEKSGRFTSLHFKELGVRMLPIPHPGNGERVQYKNFVGVTGLKKMLGAKREMVEKTKRDHRLFSAWPALCAWLLGSAPEEASLEVRCVAAHSVVLKVD